MWKLAISQDWWGFVMSLASLLLLLAPLVQAQKVSMDDSVQFNCLSPLLRTNAIHWVVQ